MPLSSLAARRLAAALLAPLLVAPPVFGAEEPLISNARQLVFEGKRSGEGYFSEVGGVMIFQSERERGIAFYQL